MAVNPKNWKQRFYYSNEGVGTLYDRLLLEKIFDQIIDGFKIKNI